MVNYYKQDKDGNAVPVGSLLDVDYKRRVAEDIIGDTSVSTVFLAFDHGWGGGPPVLWETMVFGKKSQYDEEQERYASRADALAGHARWVAKVREESA